ncbi:hypothetical protein AAH994_10780 [Weeksellaceae bacterium A-14]
MSEVNAKNEKALDTLSKALEIESLQENEAGELVGGFSETLSEESAEEGIIVNFSKCHCGGSETVQP